MDPFSLAASPFMQKCIEFAKENDAKVTIEINKTKTFIKLYKVFKEPDGTVRRPTKRVEIQTKKLDQYNVANLFMEMQMFLTMK